MSSSPPRPPSRSPKKTIGLSAEPQLKSVQIPEFEKAVDDAGKTFYRYCISVSAAVPKKSWVVKRRFCQFYDLYNSISTTRKLKFPEPSLMQFSLPQYDLAESRIKKLEKFLSTFAGLGDLTEAESGLLLDFLDVGDHHLSAAGRAHSDSGTISPPLMCGDGASDSGLEEERERGGDAAPPEAAAGAERSALRRPSELHYVDTEDMSDVVVISDYQNPAIGPEEKTLSAPDMRAVPSADGPPRPEPGGSSWGYALLGLLALGGVAAVVYNRARRR